MSRRRVMLYHNRELKDVVVAVDQDVRWLKGRMYLGVQARLMPGSVRARQTRQALLP